MKVQDEASNFSLVDVNKDHVARGSAHFVNTRLVSNDPNNFGRSDTNSQFKIKADKGSLWKNRDMMGKSKINSAASKESKYLNQQR